MFTMGFQQEYYTLWDVNDNGENGLYRSYIQNLSKNKYKALEMIDQISDGKYEIDLSLCGTLQERNRIRFASGRFQFGRFAGQEFETCDDYGWLAWYASCLSDSDFDHQERDILRPILEAKGYHFENEHIYSPEQWKRHIFYKSMIYDLFYQAGDRITLELKHIFSKSFDTDFGRMYIETFVDKDNRVFQYKGSNVYIFDNNDDFLSITGTIKHNVWKDRKTTLIQRIKFN